MNCHKLRIRICHPSERPTRRVREQRVLRGRDALHGDDRAPLLGIARRPRNRVGRLQQRRVEEPLPLHRLRLQVEQNKDGLGKQQALFIYDVGR